MLYSSGSIEIDHIDVSNLRRFSSRRNRIGSNRTNVTKSAVQWEFEYAFFAITLNPMGKRRCLEIEDYAGDTHSKTRRRMRPKRNVNRTSRLLHSPSGVSLSGRIHCGPTVFSAKSSSLEDRLDGEINVKDSARSMEFLRFLHIQMSSRRRNKAKTIRWDPSDRVLGRFDL